MSVLVVGVSHKTAPVSVLERLALTPDGVGKLIADVSAIEHVTEVTALATCNRIEVYAEVDRFHGSVEEVSRLLCERSGMATSDITSDLLPHLYVHYDDGAVSHLFHVAAGLDSMVVGEGQILGQARDALRTGQELGTVGPALNSLFQQALRVGKRSHAETDIDRAAPSMVSAALDRAVAAVGPVTGSRVLVIGAGAMASLAVATASRRGAADITVVNRTETNAERLADEYAARSLPLSSLADALGNADIVISCTGATGIVVTAAELVAARGASERPVAVLDLALPHDVDPAVAQLSGVTLIDLRVLADELRDSDAGREVLGVRQIVGQEISAFVSARRQASVTPTVVALRTMATGVVDAEIERLFSRVPDLDEAARAEVLHAVRRVADKLLHQPTVRVKELANSDGAVSYAAALAELFALDPEAVDAVTRPVTPTSPTDLAGVPVSELPTTVEETQA
jgi:glutamyl-tRNA reductase